jgi:hypothetical protein
MTRDTVEFETPASFATFSIDILRAFPVGSNRPANA